MDLNGFNFGSIFKMFGMNITDEQKEAINEIIDAAEKNKDAFIYLLNHADEFIKGIIVIGAYGRVSDKILKDGKK